MRSGLIAFGVIFLVLGVLFYFVPMQQVKAGATTTENGETDVYGSSAKVTVPVEWSYALGAIGFILLIFGLAIPGSNPRTRDSSKKDSYDKVYESKESIKVGKGNKRRIVREQTEKHKSREDDN
jgi:uncharacterized membrane protein